MSPLWAIALLPALALANDFNTMDRDKDGKVTIYELYLFVDRLDLNRDKVVTKDELFNFLNKNYSSVKAYSDNIFTMLDYDNDGKLAYKDAVKVSMAMDTSKNTFVEKAEYDKWAQNFINNAQKLG